MTTRAMTERERRILEIVRNCPHGCGHCASEGYDAGYLAAAKQAEDLLKISRAVSALLKRHRRLFGCQMADERRLEELVNRVLEVSDEEKVETHTA